MFRKKDKEHDVVPTATRDQVPITSAPVPVASGVPGAPAVPKVYSSELDANAQGNPTALARRKNKWRGLIHDEDPVLKRRAFICSLIISICASFTQFGFIGIGTTGNYICYAMGLLVPVMATTILLGKGAGALQGFLSGAVLNTHARLMPLDLIERYYVSALNSYCLFAFAGFLGGLLLSRALRNGPTGKRRIVYLGIVSGVLSPIVTVAFLVNSFLNMVANMVVDAMAIGRLSDIPRDWVVASEALGSLSMQIIVDFILMFAILVAVDDIVRRSRKEEKVSVRTSFHAQLLAVVLLIFAMLAALSFTAITLQCTDTANDDMGGEIEFIGNHLVERDKLIKEVSESPGFDQLPDDVVNASFAASNGQQFIEGYSLTGDGTVVVFQEDKVLYTNNPAFPKDATPTDLFGDARAAIVDELAQSHAMKEMLYLTQPIVNADGSSTGSISSTAILNAEELGYMRVEHMGDYDVMMAMPFTKVFSDREVTMRWSTAIAGLLLAVVYVLVSRLLNRNVVAPIDHTNEQLAEITAGNLNIEVTEDDNIEFASLSSGINKTVTALKSWIDEANERMESELATAKAIQESALPRVFPPFPEVDKFDIFAAMDAAKEVGGDFYDFFLIDDRTLGFLIADVSGKGIPGALFMMAAKTEIENYMSTGMDLSQAIATANKRLCANNDAGMFVTVWAGVLDYNTGELTYVNAGHNFPLLRHGAGGEWEWLKKKCGLFLGTFETAKYRKETITLEPGDELLLYTDGVNEAFNVEEQEYGNDRLEAFLAEHNGMHSREIVRALRSDVAQWAEGAEQSDDVTILALEYGVAPEVTGTVTIDATLDNLPTAIDLVNTELEKRLCPLDIQHKVEVALEELLVNVCRYAYADQEEPGKVQVSYAYGVNPSSITVEIRDQGVAFNPVNREDPESPSGTLDIPIGGLGILMVRRTMDEFLYFRDRDTNIVIFKKGW